jgi:hypothetical protein
MDRSDVPHVPACEACGAERVFEFQVRVYVMVCDGV